MYKLYVNRKITKHKTVKNRGEIGYNTYRFPLAKLKEK